MSQEIEPADRRSADHPSGLETLRRSPEFRGPVEPMDDHEHTNDHFALVYETREEQFAAAIPFIREGLERGERCLYITHETTREEVLEAMRRYDVDADAALESGALSIHDETETYLRSGTFDADDTISFLDDAIAEAVEEYEALRVTGEMSSVLGEDPDGEELVRCEAKANYLFDEVDGVALCQYDRRRFPPELIRDVISTHPLLVHDGRVSHNVYYTPPEEFFGPAKSEREVDRLLGTLREQTDAKTELEERQQYLRRQNEITASPDRTFEEKLQALFELGCERFDLELGAMARVDPETDSFEIEYASGDHDYFAPGTELPLSETYCTAVTDRKGPASVSNPFEEGYEDITVHRNFGMKAYLGTYVEVDGGPDRTFFFATTEPRDTAFSEIERTFHHMMGQWVRKELEREHRESQLQSKNERLESFASLLAHELRNPVAIGQIYSRHLPDEADSEAVDYVREAFDRIEDMIDVMLVLTRGQEVIRDRIPVEFADVARGAWDEVGAPDATLDVAVDRTIAADETYLQHLFRNLFENAVEHGSTSSQPSADNAVEHGSTSNPPSDDDAVKHGSTSKQPTADDAVEHGGAGVTVTVGELPTGFYVADDGPGIPAEDRDAVFEAGYTTASDNGGTGLGLAFVQKLAEVYEWDCTVTESEDGGARFEFRGVDRDLSDN